MLDVLREQKLLLDAPCGGMGSCGKCMVIAGGVERLACQTRIETDMTVSLPRQQDAQILMGTMQVSTVPDGEAGYCLAFDLGTTTVAAYLMDAVSGKVLARTSCMNPQRQYGADVISRLQYVLQGGDAEMSSCIHKALSELTLETVRQAEISADEIRIAAIVGNTAMHHLLLELDPRPLTVPPYMPAVKEALCLPADSILPISSRGIVRILPNIAGFVGADTVGCLLAARMDTVQELTLLIDIGTNGEIVLGDRRRRIACSTAAGPAFEGAKIECGVRGIPGAIDHVTLLDGKPVFHTIGGERAVGFCGSGLLDLIAVLLEINEIDGSGRMQNGDVFRIEGTGVYLTQKDIREVQLAKAAIRAGIELLCNAMNVKAEAIRQVLLAGAFGNYLTPRSACTIGMIPPELCDKIHPIGNAAGAGAQLAALSSAEFEQSKKLALKTEFLELASVPEFNDCYVECLYFREDQA